MGGSEGSQSLKMHREILKQYFSLLCWTYLLPRMRVDGEFASLKNIMSSWWCQLCILGVFGVGIQLPVGAFKYLLFSSLHEEDEPILTHKFQLAWFNHQLAATSSFFFVGFHPPRVSDSCGKHRLSVASHGFISIPGRFHCQHLRRELRTRGARIWLDLRLMVPRTPNLEDGCCRELASVGW